VSSAVIVGGFSAHEHVWQQQMQRICKGVKPLLKSPAPIGRPWESRQSSNRVNQNLVGRTTLSGRCITVGFFSEAIEKMKTEVHQQDTSQRDHATKRIDSLLQKGPDELSQAK
jgi:hypothetical protein